MQYKILIVDDNKASLQLLITMLSRMGHFVVIAENGVEAVDLFKKNDFHMILMDYMMPLMDGIEATKKIRDIEKNQPSHSRTPIIAVSGKLTDDVKTSLISAGVDDFIAKPFSAKTLAGIIDTFTSH